MVENAIGEIFDATMSLTGKGILIVAVKECGDAKLATALAMRLAQMGMTVWVKKAEADKDELADQGMEGQ